MSKSMMELGLVRCSKDMGQDHIKVVKPNAKPVASNEASNDKSCRKASNALATDPSKGISKQIILNMQVVIV